MILTKKILLLDSGKEWGGGTNSMIELIKRINKNKFDITCCFYFNYNRQNGETIKIVLQRMNIPVHFITQIKQPKFVKIIKECLKILLFFNKKIKKK